MAAVSTAAAVALGLAAARMAVSRPVDGGEPRLTGLRRRGLVVDGPRVLARDAREDERYL